MKPFASAIVISLAASGVVAAAAAHNKKKQLRGGKPNQQHRSLEGECVGVPSGQWRPTPGCHGAALCINDETFFLYPCNEEEGFLYDEARGGCAPEAEVTCTVGWESIGVEEGDSAGDIEAGDEEGETGGEEDTGDATEGETAEADADAETDAETDADADADAEDQYFLAEADVDTADATVAEEDNSDGTEVASDGETGIKKEKRVCNAAEEKMYFKACKKLHCVGLGDAPLKLEECKEMCRQQECEDSDDEEEDQDAQEGK